MLVRIDGLDQAKTTLPRNLEDNKAWARCWRPQMHCIGVLIECLLDAYFLADEDLTNGSHTECNALSHALDLAHDELTVCGLTMPEHLQLNYDFTGREGNNQTVATWMAWMQARGKFQTIQDGA